MKNTHNLIRYATSKKTMSEDEYWKVKDLINEMEVYIEINIDSPSFMEVLDDELFLLRKINAEHLKRLKEDFYGISTKKKTS